MLRKQWEGGEQRRRKGKAKESRRRYTALCCYAKSARACGLATYGQRQKVGRKRGKRKAVGWSTKEMDEKVTNFRVEDTEEMVSWRSLSQQDTDKVCMRMAEHRV